MFGSAQAYNSRAFEFYLWDESPEFNYNAQWILTDNNISVDNVLELDWNKNIVNYSINNVQQQAINYPTGVSFVTPYTMYIFTTHRPGGAEPGLVGSIYYFKIYDNGTLVRDMVPARRNSDGVLGLYDMVTNTFFTNNGTGEFIAGPDVVGCVNVGAGYWAAASTVNFGSVGTRNACPAGTYSDIENASACKPCAGATYNDKTAAASCIACPDGYDYNTDSGKTDITQCQIHCDAGTWNEYTQLDYIESTGTQYIDTGYIPNQSSGVKTKVRFNSVDNNKALVFGSAQAYNSRAFEFFLWDGSPEFDYNAQWKKVTGNNISVDNVLELDWNKNIVNYSINNVQQQTINFTAGAFVAPYTMNIFALHRPDGAYLGLVGSIYYFKIYDNGTLVRDMIPVRRNVDGVLGMYDKVTNTFFTNSGTGEFIAGPDVGGECVDVGVGYWAAASTVNFGLLGTKNACPVGTTTVGYGHGADSANDCGRVLHIGDYVLYARRDRVTSPSLNIRIPEEGIIYYINLGSANHDLSRLHLMLDGVQYTAYDDSLYYGERDFDTGEQIAQ